MAFVVVCLPIETNLEGDSHKGLDVNVVEDLSQLVRSFAGHRILLVGDLILDRYTYGDAERISPEAPVPVLRVVERREAVGGSANVAACLGALGCRTVCCGVVGKDRHGQTLMRLLEELDVDTSGVVVISDRPTTTKTRLVGLAQHRHRQQLLRVDEEETSPLPPKTATALATQAAKLVAECDVVCIEDYDKGLIDESLVKCLVAEAKRCGVPVLADPARLDNYGRYRGVDLITPNREELSIATGKRFTSIEELAAAGEQLIDSLDIAAMVATVDREGAVLMEKGKDWRHISTTPRSVYDNTGAGDAVLAMLAASVASGADLQQAAHLANIAGGLEVEKFGCVPITHDEVLAELRLEDRERNGKLRSPDELVAELGLRRDRGETIAFTNGCFDILHAGHVEYLKRARQEASLLVVGLNSDDSIRQLGKGDDRPVNTFANRATVLGALSCVDYVVEFEEPTPESLIRKIKPDVLVKGEDWAKRGVVGSEFVEANGGRVVLVPLVEGLSTTKVIEKMGKK